MTAFPATLDHAGIAARVPHAGAMCLLNALLSWSHEEIVCSIGSHADAQHPLRLGGILPAASALEYASQAMALHGGLCRAPGAAPTPGFLASARQVRFHTNRLDDAAGPLQVRASRLAGDAGQAMYRFELRDAQAQLLVEGRATVVLDTPLTLAAGASR
jgi:predicted hotdog family 3-hydroxylacyl-ACP dehydratase